MIPSTVIARRALNIGQSHRSTSVIRSQLFVPHKIPNTTIANDINIGVRLQLYQQVNNNRMISTEGGENVESDQSISPGNTAPASESPSQPIHTRPPVTNFTKMLQYQKQPSPHQDNRRGNNNNNNNNNTGGFAGFAQRREGNTNTPNNLAAERPSWRDGYKANYRQYNNKRRSKRKNRKSPQQQPELKLPTNVATSEWVEISGTPPNTKLSDLYSSLNSIIEYELNKGILDLDSLGSLDGVDNATMKALNSVDALKSLYSEQNINGDNNTLPLWTPSSDYFDSLHKGGGDTCPIICEARIHLSYRARPMGWFLRFPNRSVVNAVLNHVRRARYSWHDLSLKEARRDWREGLWRGVYDEYEVKANEKERDMALKEEDHDEKELMWGGEFTTEEETDIVMKDEGETEVVEGDLAPETTSQEEGDDNMQASDIEGYMNNYSEAFPFPRQGQVSTPSASTNQLLKVASLPLKIREFLPYPSDIPIDSDHHRQPPWEQHSFHLSSTLNLSENVVRVETEDLRVNERDVRFWFRGYDTESIQLKENSNESTVNGLTPYLAEYPERQLNWNVNNVSKDQSNVDFLIKGIPHRELKYEHKRKGTPIKSTRNTFLVRFATSSDARMAVRDKGGKPAYRGGPYISMSQYPNIM